MALSDTSVCTAKPRDMVYRLSDAHGLYIEVHPSGSRYWRLKYRFAGKEKRLSLGVYPLVSLATRARLDRFSAIARRGILIACGSKRPSAKNI